MTSPSRPSLAPVAPAALPVRRLSLRDLAACADLAESRGWGREEHMWRLLLTAGRGFGVDAPDRAGALIGTYVLASYAALGGPSAAGAAGPVAAGARPTAPGAAAGCAAVGMVLVAERFAGRGLGRLLMEHARREAGPVPVFLTATEAGRRLYERLGYTSVGALARLTGRFAEPAAGAASGGAGGVVVRTATAADMAGVLALDGPAFGADRTQLLVRLPAFSNRFVVAEHAGGGLAGYAASWPGATHTVIGPVVAADLPTAQALVADLGRHAPGAVRCDVDERHGGLVAWLRAHGLGGDATRTLMVQAAPDLPGDVARRFAPLSVALG